jgi:integrase
MLDADQVTDLRAKLAGDEWRAPVVTALYTGLRRGEQLALRWHRIDLDGARMQVVEALDEAGGEVTVKQPKTASGRRTITMPAIVVSALREHRQQQLERCLLLGLGRPPDDALVFPGPERRPGQPARVLDALGTRGGAFRRAGDRLAQPAAQSRLDADRRRVAGHDGGRASRACGSGRDAEGLLKAVRKGRRHSGGSHRSRTRTVAIR